MLDSEDDCVARRCQFLVRLQEGMSVRARYEVTASDYMEVQEQERHVCDMFENTLKVHFTRWHSAEQGGEAVSRPVEGKWIGGLHGVMAQDTESAGRKVTLWLKTNYATSK
jgi:hypothetical protein